MKQKRKMKKGLKIFIIVIVVLIVTCAGIIIWWAFDDLKQEEELKAEIMDYNNRNLATDNFSVKIKTKGDCAYVEQAVKKYYKSLSDNVKTINYNLNNEKISKLFTAENLESDRPDFTLSHATIKKTKNNVNNAIKKVDKLCEEKTIKSLLDKDKLDDVEYYYEFYLDLIYTKEDKKNFKALKNEMDEFGKQINLYLDKVDEMLNFLQENDKAVKYGQNGQTITFKNQTLFTEWKKLMAELDEISGNLSGNTEKSNDSGQA